MLQGAIGYSPVTDKRGHILLIAPLVNKASRLSAFTLSFEILPSHPQSRHLKI
jgi:hypothetical protein